MSDLMAKHRVELGALLDSQISAAEKETYFLSCNEVARADEADDRRRNLIALVQSIASQGKAVPRSLAEAIIARSNEIGVNVSALLNF